METGISLIQIACAIYIVLGVAHAFLTLFTKAMNPVNPEVLALNKSNHAFITSKTSLWSGGVGFHLSHSLGLFVFGAFYFTLVDESPELILSSQFFSLALLLVPLTYLSLSLKYWFILPSIGLGLACVLSISGLLYITT